MNRLYVYYRVPPQSSLGLLGKLALAFDDILQRSGVKARVGHRLNDPCTWMEVYEPVPNPDSFVSLLREMEQRYQLGTYVELGTVRHLEQFVDLAT